MRKKLPVLAVLLMAFLACSSEHARSDKSFDEIGRLVSGKTTTEVQAILGKPDLQEKLPLGDWRWVWWNYTSLKETTYPPEVRNKPVHLEIMFSSKPQVPESQWRVSDPLAVTYSLPKVARPGAL